MNIFKPISKSKSNASNRRNWRFYLRLQQYIRQWREEARRKTKRIIWLLLVFLDWMSKMPIWLFCYRTVERPKIEHPQTYWDKVQIAEIRYAREQERRANPRFPFLPERYKHDCPSIKTLIEHLSLDFTKDDAFTALLWNTPVSIHDWMRYAYRMEGARLFRQCFGSTSTATLERMIVEADRWKAQIADEVAKTTKSKRKPHRPRSKPKATRQENKPGNDEQKSAMAP